MALRAGYKGIKKYIADMLNAMSPGDGIATDAEVAEQIAVQEKLLEDTVGWTGEELATTITPDHVIGSTGNEAENDQFNIIEYMEVIEGDTYVFKGTFEGNLNRNNRIHGYNSSKVWVEQILQQTTSSSISLNLEFTIPSGIKYIRMSLGDTCTSYSIKHISADEQKADNSVISPVENGTTASQAYAVNDVFIRNGALCKVTSEISQGDTLSNQFTETNVGAILTALLNA